MPLWWNWQTPGIQNPVVAIPCRFDPDQRHHKEQIKSFDLVCSFFLPDVGGEPKVRQYAQHILAEGSRLRETAIPKGYRPAAITIK